MHRCASYIGKVYAAGEFDQNVWTIQGEPNTEVIINRPATVELTCATIVNRIPDLIAAAPGFTTTDKMQTNAFRARISLSTLPDDLVVASLAQPPANQEMELPAAAPLQLISKC